MLIDGTRVRGTRTRMEVRDPYLGAVIDTVPVAGPADIERALAAGTRGAKEMALLPGHSRAQVLARAADIVASRAEQLAELITREEGKPLSESAVEVRRIPDLLRLCAFEGTQVRGETLPLDAHAGAEGKLGIAMRVPAGLIVAITPFNYPLMLVVHKVAPALAAGNAVILKPASATPLTALALCQILLDAGLPPRGLQCLTGPGMDVGAALVADERVRMVSFTGSAAAGKEVARLAAGKKVSLELGSNCPMVVLDDADLEAAAAAAATGGYVNAGQACISVQRVIVVSKRYGDFVDRLVDRVSHLTVGDPFEPATKVAAMINEREAARVESWIAAANRDGATITTGGERTGAVMIPTVVADVKQQMHIAKDELFGPAVAVMRARGADHALALANAGHHGLGASLFTADLRAAHVFARQVEAGNVMINASPLWRADLMPFGGLGGSGFGREGPRYAVQEMTELKTVVFHGVG
jgi:acyl-CoA reductase-like NAD-dependent aldehyde dehydrogenase